ASGGRGLRRHTATSTKTTAAADASPSAEHRVDFLVLREQRILHAAIATDAGQRFGGQVPVVSLGVNDEPQILMILGDVDQVELLVQLEGLHGLLDQHAELRR